MRAAVVSTGLEVLALALFLWIEVGNSGAAVGWARAEPKMRPKGDANRGGILRI